MIIKYDSMKRRCFYEGLWLGGGKAEDTDPDNCRSAAHTVSDRVFQYQDEL